MNQDLIEWLREKNSHNETALLVVPMSTVQPEEENEEKNENIEPEIKPEVKNLSEWHEAAVKLNLSIAEPPIELWTQISESIEEDDEDDNYEPSMSLQGNAYVQLPTEHGKNFTQRLHKTLKERQQKAEILREEEENERRKQHPYTLKSIILCSVLIIEVALSCIILFVLNRYSLAKKFEAENFKFEFESEDVQVQVTVEQTEIEPETHEETHEIEIILPQIGSHDEKIKLKTEGDSKDILILNESSEIEKIEEIESEYVPLTFEELLQEGNNAYNSEVYDMAVLIFHSALEMNNDDIRPYIGLIESYRAKKMYFDSKRILDEARIKFRKNPTLETELKLLKGEKKYERKRCKRK